MVVRFIGGTRGEKSGEAVSRKGGRGKKEARGANVNAIKQTHSRMGKRKHTIHTQTHTQNVYDKNNNNNNADDDDREKLPNTFFTLSPTVSLATYTYATNRAVRYSKLCVYDTYKHSMPYAIKDLNDGGTLMCNTKQINLSICISNVWNCVNFRMLHSGRHQKYTQTHTRAR